MPTRPITHLDRPRVLASLEAALERGQLCGPDGGVEVGALESEFSSYVGAAHGVAVSSGSVALLTALRALGAGPGDEVVLPAFTFIADLLAVLNCGATPVFADVGDDYLVDPDAVGAALSERTKAVLVVHLFGLPARMDAILAHTEPAGVPVLEDCCQAHGAVLDGRRAGTFGTLSAFSFSQGHIVSGGTGGMVLTDDESLSVALRKLRFHGVSELAGIGRDEDRDYASLGFNYALGELSAAVARVHLERIDDILASRAALAEVYENAFAPYAPDLVELPSFDDPRRVSAHHLYPVRIAHGAPLDRDALGRELRARQVGFFMAYPKALHQVEVVRDAPTALAARCPRSEDLATRTLGLFCGLDIHDDAGREDLARRTADAVEAARHG